MVALVRPVPTLQPAQHSYRPYGGSLRAWKSGKREVVCAGPANTGKTRGNLEKLHFCAKKYAGMRGLMLRKTRKSLTHSAMVTYEHKVLSPAWHDAIHFDTQDQQYEYPNGSIIAVSGLDDPQKVMSSEWDFIVVPEATELDEGDWQALTIRLRNHVMPYQQLLGDCNPGPANHWLKLRCERGKTQMLESRHEDNPSITQEDIATLDALTGVWYLRYRKGIWATAEGVVYEEFDPAIHLIYRFDIPPAWPRYWVIDWGFRNPFVWQAWAQNHDGELFCYREIYTTGKIVEDLAKQIMQVTAGEPAPVAIICDHDAEDRATFERHTGGMETIPASKAIGVGIQEVQKRLRIGRNGRVGLYFLRDSLVEVDPDLEQKRLPTSTVGEFDAYIWDTSNGRKLKEVPVDKDNHGMDCCRYMVRYVENPYTLEAIDPSLVAELYNYQG